MNVEGEHMNDQEFIVMVKEMVLAPNTIMRKEWVLRLMEIIVKKDLEIRKFKEREKIRDEHIIEPLQKKLDELISFNQMNAMPEGGVFVTPDILKGGEAMGKVKKPKPC